METSTVPERKYIEILLYDDILMSRGEEQKLEDNEKEDRNVSPSEVPYQGWWELRVA